MMSKCNQFILFTIAMLLALNVIGVVARLP